jgi:hypothetical protein
MDASHREWFSSLLDDFHAAIDTGRWVNSDTVDAVMCMATIHTAYDSAQQGARELLIRDAASLFRSGEAERPQRSAPMHVAELAPRP